MTNEKKNGVVEMIGTTLAVVCIGGLAVLSALLGPTEGTTTTYVENRKDPSELYWNLVDKVLTTDVVISSYRKIILDLILKDQSVNYYESVEKILNDTSTMSATKASKIDTLNKYV